MKVEGRLSSLFRVFVMSSQAHASMGSLFSCLSLVIMHIHTVPTQAHKHKQAAIAVLVLFPAACVAYADYIQCDEPLTSGEMMGFPVARSEAAVATLLEDGEITKSTHNQHNDDRSFAGQSLGCYGSATLIVS